MKKNIKNSIWMMAIAVTSLAMPFVACSNDDNEIDKVNAKERVESSMSLSAYAINPKAKATRNVEDVKTAVFTDEDIEWFDLNTRELRFNLSSETIYKRLKSLDRMEFRLGDDILFEVDNLVNPTDSRTYFNLVLYYEWIWKNEEKVGVGYYLYDCYPKQFIDDELTVQNKANRANQWEAFIKYLDSKGKLRK